MTWTQITCQQREDLDDTDLVILSGFTDMEGDGDGPSYFREWGYDENRPAFRDYRWHKSGRGCEHYRYEPGDSP